MPSSTLVRYRKRDSGEIVEEAIFSERTLRWFYGHPVGWLVFNGLLNNRAFCDWYGRQMDRPKTAARIPGFIAQFGIDMAEAVPAEYASFNAFFTRRLVPGARPFDPDPRALCSAGDGKLLVYPELADDVRLPIKGTACSPAALLAGDASAFAGGAALVLRLAPYDYHRFHFPDGGTAQAARQVPGGYHSVNPIALARVPNLFCKNKRDVTLVDTDHFGRVAIIEVAAITIGTIVQTYAPGRVERGQEKGYFQYGGSTVVVLFQKGRVRFDADLVADSAAGTEVAVRCGSRIGLASGCALPDEGDRGVQQDPGHRGG
jgi:phosphatidylserine decarboxylase